MEAWADIGIASVAIDLRGHGRSGGRRAYCRRFEEFLDDALELERLVAETNAPALLFGHSFGGLVAASSALARPAPWRALLLSAPFFEVAMKVPRIKTFAAEIASRLTPTLAMPNDIRSSDVTHDAALARSYDSDPLVVHVATARWFTETRAAQQRALAQASSLVMPLYVVLGTADRVVKGATTRQFFEHASSSDKTWDAREGLFHEVLNEPEWRGIAEKLAQWIVVHA
jgi:alpha-beta hydrolase superfamily lysophospholipase